MGALRRAGAAGVLPAGSVRTGRGTTAGASARRAVSAAGTEGGVAYPGPACEACGARRPGCRRGQSLRGASFSACQDEGAPAPGAVRSHGYLSSPCWAVDLVPRVWCAAPAAKGGGDEKILSMVLDAGELKRGSEGTDEMAAKGGAGRKARSRRYVSICPHSWQESLSRSCCLGAPVPAGPGEPAGWHLDPSVAARRAPNDVRSAIISAEAPATEKVEGVSGSNPCLLFCKFL